MGIRKSLINYLNLPFLKHFLIVINLLVFFLISFISLALDTRTPFNYINIALVGLQVGVTVLYCIITKAKPKLSLFLVCNIIMVLAMLTSYAVHGFSSFPKTPILLSFLSCFLFIWFEQNKRTFRFCLLSFLFATWSFLVLFVAVEYKSVFQPDFSARIGGSFGNENDVARHVVFAMLFNIYYFYSFKNRFLKVSCFAFSALCLYLLLLIGSISNILLSFIIVFVFLLVVSNKKTKLFLSIIFLTGAISFFVLVFTLPFFEPIKSRLLSIFSSLFGVGNYRYDSSTAGRFSAAIYGFKLFFSSPLFGNGFDSVVNNYKIMAHNNIAEIGADYGIIALIFEEVLILFPLIQRTPSKKSCVFVKPISIYIFLVQFFLVVFNSKIESILLPLIYIYLDKNDSVFVYITSRFKNEISDQKYYEAVI